MPAIPKQSKVDIYVFSCNLEHFSCLRSGPVCDIPKDGCHTGGRKLLCANRADLLTTTRIQESDCGVAPRYEDMENALDQICVVLYLASDLWVSQYRAFAVEADEWMPFCDQWFLY